MTKETWVEVLDDWQQRVVAYQQAQYTEATSLSRRYYGVGLPVTVLAAVTGTTVFTNLDAEFSYSARLTVVVVSLVAAILSAVHTFYNFGARSEQCRSVSMQFGHIRREIDILRHFPPTTLEAMETKLRDLNGLIQKVSNDAPLIEAPRQVSRSGGSGGSGGSHVMISKY